MGARATSVNMPSLLGDVKVRSIELGRKDDERRV
jgi:hypothetical protein